MPACADFPKNNSQALDKILTQIFPGKKTYIMWKPSCYGRRGVLLRVQKLLTDGASETEDLLPSIVARAVTVVVRLLLRWLYAYAHGLVRRISRTFFLC